MILFVLAAGGLVLVVAFVRYGRIILRWGLRAQLVMAGLFLWIALGHLFPVIGYLGYIFPFVVAAWIFRNRILARFPRLREHLRQIPAAKRREFERAFKDETDDEGLPRVPKVTRYERWEEDADA